MPLRILGLCGFEGAGKSMTARYLEHEHGFVVLSFAAVLKDVVATAFSWPRDLLEGETEASRAWREQPDAWWAAKLGRPDFSPRQALREWGTDLIRGHFHSDFLILALEKRIQDAGARGARVVIADARFENEIAFVRSLPGSELWHIYRDLPEWFNAAAPAASVPPPDLHPSVWQWIRTPPTRVLHNDASPERLWAQVCAGLGADDGLAAPTLLEPLPALVDDPTLLAPLPAPVADASPAPESLSDNAGSPLHDSPHARNLKRLRGCP